VSIGHQNGNVAYNGARAEQALRASELSYRRLFESAKDGILILDFATGCIADANPFLCKLLGFSLNEMVGQTVGDLSPFKDIVSNQAMFKLLQEHGYVRYEDLPLETKDGRKIAVEFVSNVYQAGDKQVIQCNVRDITERKHTEEALSDSIAIQSSILNALPAQVALIDNEGVIVSVNEAWRRFAVANELKDAKFGVGQSYLDVCEHAIGIWSENAQAVAVGIHRVLHGETENFTMEYPCHSPTVQRWFLLRVVPLCEGSLVGAIVMHVDITERKLAEETLHSSESNMAAAQRIAHVGSWELELTNMADFDSNLIHWSDEVFRIVGYEPGAIDPSLKLFFHLVPEGEHVRIREAIEASISSREPYSIVHRLIRPNGEERVLHEMAQVFFDEKTGQPLKMIGTAQDITERKQAEAQIAEQAAVLDKARDAIFVRDLDGKILFWNMGAERLYGWTRQEVVGRKMDQFLYTHPKKLEEAYELTVSRGEWNGELLHFTKDKRELTIESHWTLIRGHEGHPNSILAINTDITEKKKLEAQFMRAQRMESIGTLAGGIAHDLNNILAPILMSIDILKSDSDSPETTKILETIEVSAKRGADIVRQVLSFARGMEGERVEVQPKHLLNDLENIIKNTFPKDIRLQFSIPNDTWTVLGDPTQVHQILLNLCVNARDAMPNGGNLTITTENCALDEQYAAMNLQAKPGRYVVISVTDSGTGIQPKILDKIFEPFFTTKELSKGTGLGLSTVLAIVKSHEGIINVYSEPGKGTTFRVYLPAMELSSEALAKQIVPISPPRGNGETILVVDDEASIRTITSQTLQAFGYHILTATDGADAVSVYAEHKNEIAVVLTDMMMPLMDGTATIHALMRINPAIKIVAASGLATDGSAAKVFADGVKHFLTKPYTAGTLLKTMRAILDET